MQIVPHWIALELMYVCQHVENMSKSICFNGPDRENIQAHSKHFLSAVLTHKKKNLKALATRAELKMDTYANGMHLSNESRNVKNSSHPFQMIHS